ncbi:MAG: hypothetical protein QNJ09_07125 [Paracoccaceae bacterium]|nr:hypothetical protein [Paracoccaceae bacterium]
MYFHLEAINFDATIFDTDDISTIRGGSMLNERLPKVFKGFLQGTAISEGGSQLLFQLSSQSPDEVETALSEFMDQSPWKHLSVTWGFGATDAAAMAASARRAPTVWSVPPIEPGWADAACPEDRTRSATTKETAKDGKTTRLVSTSVHARREEARNFRPGLFDNTDLHPPQSFHDLVRPHMRKTRIPEVVKNKIAVIAADGIGASALKARLGTAGAQALFDTFKSRLAEALCTWAEREGLTFVQDGDQIAQMDVLFWGGDDMRFVVPAHSVVSFIDTFLAETEAELVLQDGQIVSSFPHRIGVMIAQYKVPFRQLNALAGQLESAARSASDTSQSAVCLAVFESASPPFDSIDTFWSELYGPGHTAALEVFTAKEFRDLLRVCKGIGSGYEDAPGLSITQIYRILRLLGVPSRPLLPEAGNPLSLDGKVRDLLADHAERVDANSADPLAQFVGLDRARGLPLLLAQIAQIKPYVDAVAVQEGS